MITTLFRDSLPKGLCFPIGLEVLSASLTKSDVANAALVFVWRSTWAAQLFDPANGDNGKLAVLSIRPDLPRMRINATKVRAMPPDCETVFVEFAVTSDRRREVLDAFIDHGVGLVAKRLAEQPLRPFGLTFDVEARRMTISARKPTTVLTR
jgi:hypothetical protein